MHAKRQRLAAAPSLETAPFVKRERAVGVLSVPVMKVAYRYSPLSAMSVDWPMMPQCSKSLLVMSPSKLSKETMRSWMSGGNGKRHTKQLP